MNHSSQLDTAELEQLTDRLNSAIVAEYDLFRLSNDTPIPHLTPGATRAILQVIRQWDIESHENWRAQIIEAARANEAAKIAPDPFDVTVNPEDVQEDEAAAMTPQYPAAGANEPADDEASPPARDDDDCSFEDRVIAVLREMAGDGNMPGQLDWDRDKPDDLPTNNAVRRRLGMQWSELAEAAGLTPKRRGRRPKGDSADTDTDAAEPEPEPEPEPLPPTLAEVDAAEDLTADEAPPSPYGKIAAMDAEAKSDMLREIIYQLQMMAEKRTIPDATTWNQNRPAELPSAQDIVLLWRLDSWYDLAGHAGLQKPSHELRRLRGASGDRHARMLEGNGA